MLRMSVKNGEYIMVGDDVKIVFLGGGGGQTRIMIDAPKEVNIVRSKAIEKRIEDPEILAKMPKYYTQCSPDFRASASVTFQESAFASGVL